MRLINWNIERNRPQSAKALSLMAEIGSLSPDLICLTEAWESSLESLAGHVLTANGVPWSQQDAGERKVVLWSATPWTSLDRMEPVSAFGGAVSGITELQGRSVRIAGLCIPYHMASPFGQVPKAKPWEQHERFLHNLGPYLRRWRQEGPMIVLGDFNRRMPRTYGPKQSYEMLEEAFEGYDIVTRGAVAGVEAATVDHVAFGGPFQVLSVQGRSAVTPEGLKRTDHFGVVVDIDLK